MYIIIRLGKIAGLRTIFIVTTCEVGCIKHQVMYEQLVRSQ
jgi:hypothetical protein